MAKINKARFSLLGILFEKPRSGYEIRQFMLESTDHFWQETDSSIYPMLKMLEAEGKVKAKSEFVGKRERRVFNITKSGKDEFLTWMVLPSKRENRRNELLLKLFFGATISKEELIKQLALHRQKARETKKRFKRIENDVLSQIVDTHPHKPFWQMALRYGMAHVDAELRWLRECLNVLKK